MEPEITIWNNDLLEKLGRNAIGQAMSDAGLMSWQRLGPEKHQRSYS